MHLCLLRNSDRTADVTKLSTHVAAPRVHLHTMKSVYCVEKMGLNFPKGTFFMPHLFVFLFKDDLKHWSFYVVFGMRCQ